MRLQCGLPSGASVAVAVENSRFGDLVDFLRFSVDLGLSCFRCFLHLCRDLDNILERKFIFFGCSFEHSFAVNGTQKTSAHGFDQGIRNGYEITRGSHLSYSCSKLVRRFTLLTLKFTPESKPFSDYAALGMIVL